MQPKQALFCLVLNTKDNLSYSIYYEIQIKFEFHFNYVFQIFEASFDSNAIYFDGKQCRSNQRMEVKAPSVRRIFVCTEERSKFNYY